MRSIRLTDTNTLSTSNNVVIIKLNEESIDKAGNELVKILRQLAHNKQDDVIIYVDMKELGIPIKRVKPIYMIAHDMRKSIQSIHNAIFVNLNYSEKLIELAKSTDNYLVSFECSEKEREMHRAVEELEDMTD